MVLYDIYGVCMCVSKHKTQYLRWSDGGKESLNHWHSHWPWTVKRHFGHALLFFFFLTIRKYRNFNKYGKWLTREVFIFKMKVFNNDRHESISSPVITFLCILSHEYFIWLWFITYFSFIVLPYMDKLSACSCDTRYRQGVIKQLTMKILYPWFNIYSPDGIIYEI